MEIPAWIEFKKGVVEEIVEFISQGTIIVKLNIHHSCKLAVLYSQLTGPVKPGDIVLVNTTACSLGLGSGGYHFVMSNLSLDKNIFLANGHGMKLKYTPIQMQTLYSEEKDSPHHTYYNSPIDFSGKLVYIGELHSMLAPLCAYLKFVSDSNIRIAYIMTDHGALPIKFSKTVTKLKKNNLLDATITIGNAFGGDYECVNIYSGLKAALNIANCQITIISMGPGILGTETTFGFSGLELGLYVNLIAGLGGNVLYIPRIGFFDNRRRHQGISHHSLTVLKHIIQYPLPLVLPLMGITQHNKIMSQLIQEGLTHKHRIVFLKGTGMKEALTHYHLHPTTMGRGIDQEPYFFYTLNAIGLYGLRKICKNKKG